MSIFSSPDFLVLYLKHLPLGEVAKCRLICKRWNEVISLTSGPIGRAWHFWRSSYSLFVPKVMTLDFISHRLLLSKGCWNVDLALDIARLMSIRRDQRRLEMLVEEGLMNMEQLETVRRVRRRSSDDLLQNAGILALRERLITPEQAATISSAMFTYYGIIALREGLITPEQVAAMPNDQYVMYLLNDNGLAALRERLITLEQANEMPDPFYLAYLFGTMRGIVALREGLITPEQVRDMPESGYLWWLFNDNGITALREGLVIPEQVSAMPTQLYVENLFCNEHVITALRATGTFGERLITPEQVAAMPNASNVIDIISLLSSSIL